MGIILDQMVWKRSKEPGIQHLITVIDNQRLWPIHNPIDWSIPAVFSKSKICLLNDLRNALESMSELVVFACILVHRPV